MKKTFLNILLSALTALSSLGYYHLLCGVEPIDPYFTKSICFGIYAPFAYIFFIFLFLRKHSVNSQIKNSKYISENLNEEALMKHFFMKDVKTLTKELNLINYALRSMYVLLSLGVFLFLTKYIT